ncbi:MAG TPA: DNA-directed RNA polymerase subunit omega [Fimbriimonas sp.]
MLPSPDILNDYEHGKFVLSNLAAKRAKQLREGAPPLVQVDSTHPLTVALAEIAAGKIKAIIPTLDQVFEESSETPTLLVDETVPAELGMLLPALDETEVALVATHDEEEVAEVVEDEALSLSDLIEEEEEEAAAVPSDDDTLSLTDIAEEEAASDDEVDES